MGGLNGGCHSLLGILPYRSTDGAECCGAGVVDTVRATGIARPRLMMQLHAPAAQLQFLSP